MTTVLEIPRESSPKFPQLRRLSVEIYDSMIENGILTENDQVELLNGAIIEKMPKGKKHAYFNDVISDFLKDVFGKNAVVRNQNPVVLDDFSEPEPDVVLCRMPRENYLNRHPAPADVLLIVEVSDTTIYFDRTDKAQAYARAGIIQYLIVNIENNTIEDYRRPSADGFQSKQTYNAGESFSLESFPETEIAVSEFLPN